MKALLQLERFDIRGTRTRRPGERERARLLRAWVAEIVGHHPVYEYDRRFLEPSGLDFSQANGSGSRGVRACYLLEEGRVYEVQEQISWHRAERTFRTARVGIVVKVSPEELGALLQQRQGVGHA